MKTTKRTRPSVTSPPLMNRVEWARSIQRKTGTVDKYQVKKLSIPSLYRRELSLADLEAERLFIRNHKGEYCHTGVVDFQYTDIDFV